MLRALVVAVVGTIPSLALILWIERRAQRLLGEPLTRWRRLLIPLPMILLLLGTISDDLVIRVAAQLIASTHDHSGAIGGLVGYAFMGKVLFPCLGLLVVALLPFVLAGSLRQGVRLLIVIWGGHGLWMFFPFGPWFLSVAGES